MAVSPVHLTRRQVAALLGVSETDVKARDGEAFHPAKGPDGSWRYLPEEVSAAIRGTLHSLGSSQQTPGSVCADAFTAFQSGKDLAETVILLKQAPEIVRSLRSEYDSMVKTLTIPGAATAALEKLTGRTIQSGQELAAVLAELPERIEVEFLRGYQAGSQDADDFGELVDVSSGERRTVSRQETESNLRIVQERWTAMEKAAKTQPQVAPVDPPSRGHGK
jgi:hypothetical protein